MKKYGTLLAAVAFLVLFYLALQYVGPLFGGWIASIADSDDWWGILKGQSSSGKESAFYFTLACIALFCWLSYKEERWVRFKEPFFQLLRTRSVFRILALIGFPFLVGVTIFFNLTAESTMSFAPIRHPTPPGEFSQMKNPFRHPTPEMLSEFEGKIRDKSIKKSKTTEEAVLAYIDAVAKKSASEEMRAKAFERHAIEEGRLLFAKNCRPCHGIKATGDGPMARGLLREPADFTGVETIVTLVEGAVFWRIKKGGIGLPHVGGPWESAMPRWETDLTDEEIWKIIMAEYDIAGNKPREPEKAE